MDRSLVAWARAVKARQRRSLPPLWFFTDDARTPDPVGAIYTLPRALCGVVFRAGGPAAPELLGLVARACRARGAALVVAGGIRDLPAGAGRHGRGGRFVRSTGTRPGTKRFRTSSAHDRADLVRARRAGASLVFLSPVFPTASHPGQAGVGVLRWGAWSRGSGVAVAALGGVSGRNVRRLPSWVAGVGAIGALLP